MDHDLSVNGWHEASVLARELGIVESELRRAIRNVHGVRQGRLSKDDPGWRLFPRDDRELSDAWVHGIEVNEAFGWLAKREAAVAKREAEERAERAIKQRQAARSERLDAAAIYDEYRRRYDEMLEMLPKQNYGDDTG